MKELYSLRLGRIIVPVLLFFVSSCVNPDYDLSKEIVTDATLFEKISVPLGNLKKITIGEILFSGDSSVEGLKEDGNGDYSLEFVSDELEMEISVPLFNLENAQMETLTVENFSTGPLAGMDASILDLTVSYSDVTGAPLSHAMQIEVDTELPYELEDIKEINMDASLTFYFNVNAGAIYIKEGFSIEFPEYVHLVKSDNSSDYQVYDNGHTIIFDKDTKVGSDSPLALTMSFKKLEVPSGFIVDQGEGLPKKLVVNDLVNISGDFYLKTKDFTYIPENVDIVMHVGIENLAVHSALLKLNPQIEVPEDDILLDEVPDILKGEEICADLYNPVIGLALDNKTPFAFQISAAISAFKNDDELKIAIPGESYGMFDIDADSVTEFMISRREISGAKNNIVIPEIGDLIKNIPDRFRVHEVNVEPKSDFISIEAGSTYNVSLGYNVYAPLSFGKDLNLTFTQDIDNLGLDYENVGVASMTLDMVLVNTIPLTFTISAICLDDEGNEITQTRIRMSDPIAAGSPASPTELPVSITVENDLAGLNINGLRLQMTAESNADYEGICLNSNQGFEINDIVLSLPDGVRVSLEDIKNMEE